MPRSANHGPVLENLNLCEIRDLFFFGVDFFLQLSSLTSVCSCREGGLTVPSGSGADSHLHWGLLAETPLENALMETLSVHFFTVFLCVCFFKLTVQKKKPEFKGIIQDLVKVCSFNFLHKH